MCAVARMETQPGTKIVPGKGWQSAWGATLGTTWFRAVFALRINAHACPESEQRVAIVQWMEMQHAQAVRLGSTNQMMVQLVQRMCVCVRLALRPGVQTVRTTGRANAGLVHPVTPDFTMLAQVVRLAQRMCVHARMVMKHEGTHVRPTGHKNAPRVMMGTTLKGHNASKMCVRAEIMVSGHRRYNVPMMARSGVWIVRLGFTLMTINAG